MPVAARVLRHAAVAALLDDAVVREVGLEAAVLGDAQQLARPPARDGRTRVAPGALDRSGDLADQEAVEHRVGRLRRQEVDERVGIGDRAGARRDRVVGLEVGEPTRTPVGVGGRDEHVALGEAGALGCLLDEAAGAREQVERDQRHLAAPALQHHRGRKEARVLSLPGAVGPHEAAERVARLRRDVRASHARAQRSGGARCSRARQESKAGQAEQRQGDADRRPPEQSDLEARSHHSSRGVGCSKRGRACACTPRGRAGGRTLSQQPAGQRRTTARTFPDSVRRRESTNESSWSSPLPAAPRTVREPLAQGLPVHVVGHDRRDGEVERQTLYHLVAGPFLRKERASACEWTSSPARDLSQSSCRPGSGRASGASARTGTGRRRGAS